MIGQDEWWYGDPYEDEPPPVQVMLPDVIAYEGPGPEIGAPAGAWEGYDPSLYEGPGPEIGAPAGAWEGYDPSLYEAPGPEIGAPAGAWEGYDPSLYEVPDLPTAIRASWDDVFGETYEPTAGERALGEQAAAEIVAARDAGGDWQGVMRGWATTLNDTLRAALPSVLNRILGTTPAGGRVVARGPRTAGFQIPTWAWIAGAAVLALTLIRPQRASGGRRQVPRRRRRR